MALARCRNRARRPLPLPAHRDRCVSGNVLPEGADRLSEWAIAVVPDYRRFRQNQPFQPSESCFLPRALLLTEAPRRPTLTPAPRFDRLGKSPGAIRLRRRKPNATAYFFSQATPSLSRSSPLLCDIAVL